MKDSSNYTPPEIGTSNAQPNYWAFRLALCLLGPILFLGGFFTQLSPIPVLLAPLPILYLHSGTPERRAGLLWSILAIAIGVFLCSAIKGKEEAFLFLLITAIPALVLGECLLRKWGPELAVIAALSAMITISFGLTWFDAKSQGISVQALVQKTLAENTKLISDQILAQNTGSPENTEEIKKVLSNPNSFWREYPGIGALFTAAMLMCILPCLALIRWNPKGFLRRAQIPRDFLRKWKTPDWFIWIALFFGVFLLYPVHYLSWMARNCLIPIVLIYFFQGMSILAFFLDSLRLRGPIRVLIYGASIILAPPMVVSFGFFDLWFNFRARKQAEEDDRP